MSESTNEGLKIASEMLDETTNERLKGSLGSDAFGAKLGEFSLDFVFSKVWGRPGLPRRERSLVTLGILIALRQTEELKIHTQAALRNGCTLQEIEEVLYQASVYAGFPAASAGLGAMMATLSQGGPQ